MKKLPKGFGGPALSPLLSPRPPRPPRPEGVIEAMCRVMEPYRHTDAVMHALLSVRPAAGDKHAEAMWAAEVAKQLIVCRGIAIDAAKRLADQPLVLTVPKEEG